MEHPSPERGGATQNVLLVVLVAGLAIGASLLFLMQSSQRGGAEFAVSEPEAFDCPSGAAAPVCIRYEVTNTGGEEAFMHCELTPYQDSSALFTDGTATYLSDQRIAADEADTIYVKVAAGESEEVREPTVSCTAVD
jgi:hypothetical protein